MWQQPLGQSGVWRFLVGARLCSSTSAQQQTVAHQNLEDGQYVELHVEWIIMLVWSIAKKLFDIILQIQNKELELFKNIELSS